MFCPNCGAENQDNTLVCESCGTNLDEVNQAEKQQTNPQPPITQQPISKQPQPQYQPQTQYQQPQYQQVPPQYQQQQPQYQPPQQYSYPVNQPPEKVNNYLIWSILCTIFCCLPCGIVGIVYSNKVNTALSVGNIEQAREASKNAKIWNLVGTILGAVISIGYVMLVAFGAIASMYPSLW